MCVSIGVVDDVGLTSGTITDSGVDSGERVLCSEAPTTCPPPPVDWCNVEANMNSLPEDVVVYWSSFCDGGTDASTGAAACGNGIIEGDEVCDDGNTIDGDGCASTCATIEVNF
jgi:cysteine-rich repeat protein